MKRVKMQKIAFGGSVDSDLNFQELFFPISFSCKYTYNYTLRLVLHYNLFQIFIWLFLKTYFLRSLSQIFVL